MNYKRKSKTSKYKNKMASKRKVRTLNKKSSIKSDCMRASRRNWGDGLV